MRSAGPLPWFSIKKHNSFQAHTHNKHANCTSPELQIHVISQLVISRCFLRLILPRFSYLKMHVWCLVEIVSRVLFSGNVVFLHTVFSFRNWIVAIGMTRIRWRNRNRRSTIRAVPTLYTKWAPNRALVTDKEPNSENH